MSAWDILLVNRFENKLEGVQIVKRVATIIATLNTVPNDCQKLSLALLHLELEVSELE